MGGARHSRHQHLAYPADGSSWRTGGLKPLHFLPWSKGPSKQVVSAGKVASCLKGGAGRGLGSNPAHSQPTASRWTQPSLTRLVLHLAKGVICPTLPLPGAATRRLWSS